MNFHMLPVVVYFIVLGVLPFSFRSACRLCHFSLHLRSAGLSWLLIPPGRRPEYCDERFFYGFLSVCLSVCLWHVFGSTGSKLRQIIHLCCLWPWLGPPPVALHYSVYFQLPVRRRVLANTPGACCWLRPVLSHTTAGAKIRRVLRRVGAGGGVCNVLYYQAPAGHVV